MSVENKQTDLGLKGCNLTVIPFRFTPIVSFVKDDSLSNPFLTV